MFAAPLKRLFCSHKETVLKVDRKRKRVYTECVNCLHDSPGISTTPHPQTFVSSRRIATSALNQMLHLEDSNAR